RFLCLRFFFFFSSRRRHTRFSRDWSSDVCSSDLEVRPERAQALAIRWLIGAARNRSETTMSARLSAELLDAANNRGNAVKKREDSHRMADANRAFSHYRW